LQVPGPAGAARSLLVQNATGAGGDAGSCPERDRVIEFTRKPARAAFDDRRAPFACERSRRPASPPTLPPLLSRFGVLPGVVEYMTMQPDFSRASDAELLARTAGEAAAFREVYRRHERIVVAFLARRTGDAELTADLTAETFAIALLHAGRFRGELGDSALGWLLGIARHAWLHSVERKRTERSACQRLGMELSISDASLERVEALIDAEHPDNPLLALLAGLPPDQRDAVRAHVLEERPYNELAAELDASPATLRQRVSRGLAYLRAAISEETP
jgi:RNA polymerase sigma factor (sigma-70 family)